MGIVRGRQIESGSEAPPPRVVVKLVTPTAPTVVSEAGETVAAPWTDLEADFPGLRVSPYFEPPAGTVEAGDSPGPGADDEALDPRRYFSIDLPAGTASDDVVAHLRRRPDVESAYREAGPVPPPVDPHNDPRSVSQGYLSAAPVGVDAHFAWSESIDGRGVGFVDLERGWLLDHEDLDEAGISLISGVNKDFHGHGTAVLGQVAMVDNTIGGIGIAPAVEARVVSQWRADGSYRTAAAIESAARTMDRGDVLLLEAQTDQTEGGPFLPVEIEDLVFDAIRAAARRGIIVVEAAGNGAVDLDAFEDVHGRRVLDRNSPDFRDSGAIMVGAATSTTPHARLNSSNFGSRIDCFAWGEHIDTCGDGDKGTSRTEYTGDFGGTSGASPIVAGCALLLQSMRAEAGEPLYSPGQMRDLLSNADLATASESPAVDRIGVMPDLRLIIQRERGVAPPSSVLPVETSD